MSAKCPATSLRAALVVAMVIASPDRLNAQDAIPRLPDLPSSEPAISTFTLEVGEQKVIPSHDVQSYSEGVRGIVDVRLTKDASQFVIVALKPGTTTLLFIMRDGTERHHRITVAERETQSEVPSPDHVDVRDNVRLDFYFVQLNRSYSRRMGIGWPTSVAPTFSAAYDVPSQTLTEATAVVSNQALPRLDMAESGGYAKISRQAAIITANGEKATFSGGGEVNVAVQTATSMGIQTIEFGSVVAVEPRYDSSTGRIELRLHADISELDSDRGTGMPGRIKSALDTVVNLDLGQSLILAGLSASLMRAEKSGIPGLSQIPVLGMLFGSHAKAEEESENIVVIVPSVVDSVSMQDRDRIQAALDAYRAYEGDLEEVDFVPQPVSRAPRVENARKQGKPQP